jgi:putative aminopeptidase FrvX
MARLTRFVLFSTAALGASFTSAGAQDPGSVSALATRLASMVAVTGYEQMMVDTLLQLLPGSRRDRAGNALLRIGGSPARRLLVCPLDEPGYVVGNIRPDGYLTLRRVPGRVYPLFDQQLEGHRITIRGARGVIPGVVAVRSIHLTRGRTAPSDSAFSVDDAYVDVGAGSGAEAAALGIRVLAPLTLAKRPHRYGDQLLAAPKAGRRAACAALLLAVGESVARSRPIPRLEVALVVEQELGQGGLATVANTSEPFDETLIVDGEQGVPGTVRKAAAADTTGKLARLGQLTRWSLPVRYGGTAVETVSLADAESLRRELLAWIGGDR